MQRLHIAENLLAEWYDPFAEINPLDYVYRALGMQIEMMDQNDSMVQLIMSYVYSTCEYMLHILNLLTPGCGLRFYV